MVSALRVLSVAVIVFAAYLLIGYLGIIYEWDNYAKLSTQVDKFGMLKGSLNWPIYKLGLKDSYIDANSDFVGS